MIVPMVPNCPVKFVNNSIVLFTTPIASASVVLERSAASTMT